MKHVILAAAVALSPAVLAAQSDDDGSVDEGIDLVEEGARMLLRELMKELDPAISEFEEQAREFVPIFREMTQEMGPAFVELFEQIDGIANYEPPVFLPNGDIIMRRKEDAPEFEVPDEAEIEL